jgi:RNA polymerase sigma-70 factor (ECF subfamily)
MPDINRLIKQCQQKSSRAFDELYKTYSGTMYSICLRYTKNQAEAEDLLQDCFIKILLKISDFKFEGSFEGWIRRLTITTAINYITGKKLLLIEDMSEYNKINESTHTFNIIEQMSANEILSKLNQLPYGYKIVFNLFAIEGYKHREIANMLNISENTSKTQYAKARKALIQLIEKED